MFNRRLTGAANIPLQFFMDTMQRNQEAAAAANANTQMTAEPATPQNRPPPQMTPQAPRAPSNQYLGQSRDFLTPSIPVVEPRRPPLQLISNTEDDARYYPDFSQRTPLLAPGNGPTDPRLQPSMQPQPLQPLLPSLQSQLAPSGPTDAAYFKQFIDQLPDAERQAFHAMIFPLHLIPSLPNTEGMYQMHRAPAGELTHLPIPVTDSEIMEP
ncbi:hypothetical protein B0H13DRAFT_1886586 [Mycena leptocephala]|nr:hypothetical protein B0H13DRAFT_1886586 [Mycena leptocephala]